MSGEKFLTPVQALDLALQVAGTYRPPACHSVVADRNCDPVLMPLMPCPHTDEQITTEWRAAVAAAGVVL